jgi:hypothetical protein
MTAAKKKRKRKENTSLEARGPSFFTSCLFLSQIFSWLGIIRSLSLLFLILRFLPTGSGVWILTPVDDYVLSA